MIPVGFMAWRIGGLLDVYQQFDWILEAGFDGVGFHASQGVAGQWQGIEPAACLGEARTHLRRLLERFLRADSHAVVEAPTGEKAKEVLSQSGFDLVITDRAMPDISGDEVAVAAKAVNPGTPVILLTGFGEIMKDKGEKPDGVDRVMSKPVTQNDLRSVIADIIS